jgi:1,4-alpha-glucan branching enzyme
MKQAVEGEVYHFCVVCPDAQQVYLVGAFNGWSTTATPMVRTEESVWQLSLKLIEGGGAGAPAARLGQRDRRFSYFVIDKQYMTGRAAFGNTYLLPGSWATVVRLPDDNN